MLPVLKMWSFRNPPTIASRHASFRRSEISANARHATGVTVTNSNNVHGEVFCHGETAAKSFMMGICARYTENVAPASHRIHRECLSSQGPNVLETVEKPTKCADNKSAMK